MAFSRREVADSLAIAPRLTETCSRSCSHGILHRSNRGDSEGRSVRIVAPEVGAECVVVKADVHARVQRLLYDAGALTDDERKLVLQEFGRRTGWDDPRLDVDEQYRKAP
jgi:hypothetical protein